MATLVFRDSSGTTFLFVDLVRYSSRYGISDASVLHFLGFIKLAFVIDATMTKHNTTNDDYHRWLLILKSALAGFETFDVVGHCKN